MMCEVDEDKKRILCVGLSCVDIVSVCDGYPEEDSDRRSIDQRWQRGGNASNSSTVFSILGAHIECMVCIADSHEKAFILDDFAHCGILSTYCVIQPGCSTPLSIIIVNKCNGSRTILHANKNLPEVTLDDFKKIDLKDERFSWVHFEARPGFAEYTYEMLVYIDTYNTSLFNSAEKITTSVELEKNNPKFGMLLDRADYVFISKEYARGQGCSNKEEAIHKILPKCKPGATLICAWGEDGAATAVNNIHSPTQSHEPPHIITVPIHSPPKVVDTLGAGDTFNAATIFALSHGRDIKSSVTFGCKVDGTKCGMQGFDDLKDFNFTP